MVKKKILILNLLSTTHTLYFFFNLESDQFDLLNTPPVTTIDRNWQIKETEKLGSVVTRVRAFDAEDDRLTFDIEPLTPGYFANGNNDSLPFLIDPDEGVVTLNQSPLEWVSLIEREFQNFMFFLLIDHCLFSPAISYYM